MFSLKTLRSFLFLTLFSSLIFTSCKDDDSEGITEPVKFADFDCQKCTYIVTGYENNGDELKIKPGDIICLETGQQYNSLLFKNITGSAKDPVIVRNCGGMAVVKSDRAFGIKFEDSKNFKLIGDGGGSNYGIKISTNKGFFLSMEHFTTDFEIANVEIAGNAKNGVGNNNGFAGMGIKTSPYQACDVFEDPSRKAWIMKNVIIRDNYIHDTGGEGLYIGHGFYTGRKEADCPSITYSHSIQHIQVMNNRVENTGYDGIQIKNADKDVEVHDNIIKNYGNHKEAAHDEGLFLGEGVTGKFYNNQILGGAGSGIRFQGLGDVDIYNNIIVDAGDIGLDFLNSKYNERLTNGYFNIFNNTVVNSKEEGFRFYDESGGVKRVINNLICGGKSESTLLHETGVPLTLSDNLLMTNSGDIDFLNVGKKDLRLNENSPAIDAGEDLTKFGITTDIMGNPRPRGKGFDVGAYEY